MKIIYICTLEGTKVHNGQSFQGCIEDFDKLPLVRAAIHSEYGLEFETHSIRGEWMQMWEFANASDNRDITLKVYKSILY